MRLLKQSAPAVLLLPASAAQQQFWFADQLTPGNPAFNIAVRFGLSGELNLEALHHAVLEIVRRHETLRSNFQLLDGNICQQVHADCKIEIPLTDLSLYSGSEQIGESDRWADFTARQPFTLAAEPLLRLRLLRLSRTEHTLLLTVHHSVADGWSVGVFADELGSLYEAFALGKPSPLSELAIQYGDFANWQRENAAGTNESENYWREQLQGVTPLEVPLDFPRAQAQEPTLEPAPGHIVSRLLPRDLTDRLTVMGRAHGSTLFMTMLAGLATLLERYSGHSDLTVGTQVAGRSQVEVERLIGCFVNTLALRMQLDPDAVFADVMTRARDAVTSALIHGDVPFSRVTELARVERSAEPGGLLRVNFIHQRDFVQPWNKAGLRMFAMPSRSPGVIFDLNFFAVERPDGWRLSCEYNKSLFRAATAERMLEHCENLLDAVALNPQQPLHQINFLSQTERQRILFEWNQTGFDYPRELRIPDLLAQASEARPFAVAAVCGNETILYSELEHKSNQLARYLAERGARPGAVVGVCMNRSIDMFVALLALLKTGAAYVPLDPTLPAQRLAFLCADAGLELLVTERATTNLLATEVDRVVVDAERRPIASHSGIHFDGGGSPEDIAYILYTSGSTGQPKGVEVRHRSVVNLLCALQDHLQVGSSDILLASTTLSFDIAALELFAPLLTGSQLVIATNQEAADPLLLRDLLERSQATVYQATPVRFRLLIDAGWKKAAHLKMLCGGEKMTRELADALLSRGGELWNVYGPTETTVWSSVEHILPNHEPISIGRPIANTQFYILDAHLRPVAIGTEGELLIGGDGLAKGYHNRPDLTAQRFIANPFGPGTLYRTGDRARYRDDGRVELLGRNDDQVKIRGFRVELGEVEAALQRCSGVASAAVVVIQDPIGEPTLAACFVPREDSALSGGSLRSALAQQLPPYMVPTVLFSLHQLPVTPNGKVDRRSLPALIQQLVLNQRSDFASPSTAPVSKPANADALEAALIRIWESVLHVHHVGADDNFFALGGHSILAAKMFVRISEELGQALPLATLFQGPTVRELAALIRSTDWKPSWSSLVPIRPAGTQRPLFLIHPIGGNVLNFSGFCGHFPDDQPIYGLQARGLDGKESPHTSIEAMAEDYLRQIRSVQPAGPYALGGFSAGAIVAFEMARQLEYNGEKVDTLALLDSKIDAPSDELASALSERVERWARTIRVNMHYAARVSPAEFLERKKHNLASRLAVRSAQTTPAEAPSLTPEQAFLLALRRYLPQPFGGQAVLFRAKDEIAPYSDLNLGWGKFVLGGLDVREVSGDHDTLMQEPHIGILARLLAGILAANTGTRS